jgi:hypothetical protein
MLDLRISDRSVMQRCSWLRSIDIAAGSQDGMPAGIVCP